MQSSLRLLSRAKQSIPTLCSNTGVAVPFTQMEQLNSSLGLQLVQNVLHKAFCKFPAMKQQHYGSCNKAQQPEELSENIMPDH